MRWITLHRAMLFAQWLLGVGAGLHLGPNALSLPPSMRLSENTVETLINTIYPHVADPQGNPDRISWSAPSSLPRMMLWMTSICCSGQVSWR